MKVGLHLCIHLLIDKCTRGGKFFIPFTCDCQSTESKSFWVQSYLSFIYYIISMTYVPSFIVCFKSKFTVFEPKINTTMAFDWYCGVFFVFAKAYVSSASLLHYIFTLRSLGCSSSLL